MKVRVEWDPVKAYSSRRKHGVSFDEPASVFVTEVFPDSEAVNEAGRMLMQIAQHSTPKVAS